MPFYDYRCNACGEVFEVQATMKEKEAGLDVICPKCGGREARQQLTAASTIHAGNEIPSASSCRPDSGGCCCG